jgi:uncharacterized protein YegJ (DUF2314 family)
VATALLLLGCGKEEEAAGIVERAGEPPVVGIDPGDPEMKAAEAEAQKTLNAFIAELAKPSKPNLFFGIKAPVRDDRGEVEHIWVQELTYSNGSFSGKLGNEPVDLQGMTVGSAVKVKREDVEDWMIADGDDVKGGYTVKVVEKRMKEAQK